MSTGAAAVNRPPGRPVIGPYSSRSASEWLAGGGVSGVAVAMVAWSTVIGPLWWWRGWAAAAGTCRWRVLRDAEQPTSGAGRRGARCDAPRLVGEPLAQCRAAFGHAAVGLRVAP